MRALSSECVHVVKHRIFILGTFSNLSILHTQMTTETSTTAISSISGSATNINRACASVSKQQQPQHVQKRTIHQFETTDKGDPLNTENSQPRRFGKVNKITIKITRAALITQPASERMCEGERENRFDLMKIEFSSHSLWCGYDECFIHRLGNFLEISFDWIQCEITSSEKWVSSGN